MAEWSGYEGLTGAFRKACWIADKWVKRKTYTPRHPPIHPKATLDATLWLMTFHPDRLPAWLERHEPGLLEATKEYAKCPSGTR